MGTFNEEVTGMFHQASVSHKAARRHTFAAFGRIIPALDLAGLRVVVLRADQVRICQSYQQPGNPVV